MRRILIADDADIEGGGVLFGASGDGDPNDPPLREIQASGFEFVDPFVGRLS
jgi:hypothetical protein